MTMTLKDSAIFQGGMLFPHQIQSAIQAGQSLLVKPAGPHGSCRNWFKPTLCYTTADTVILRGTWANGPEQGLQGQRTFPLTREWRGLPWDMRFRVIFR